jgi:hypothetical protein
MGQERDMRNGESGSPREQPPLALTSCRDCGSRLLQLERIWLLRGARHVAERRCPECQRRDSVVVEDAALAAWMRRERRLRAALRELVEERGERRELLF